MDDARRLLSGVCVEIKMPVTGGFDDVAWTAVLAAPGGHRDGQVAGDVLIAPVDDPVAFGDLLLATGADTFVVAVPAPLAEPAAAALTMTAFRAPHLRLARLVSPHSPLALHAGLMVARTHVAEPALGHGYLEAFETWSWSGAWMPSVASLVSPAPSSGQYLRSLLPGGDFVVGFAPEPSIGRRAVPRAGDVRLDRMLLVSDGGALGQGLVESLSSTSGASGVRPYPLPGAWGRVVGHRKAVQLALVPADPLTVPVSVAGVCTSCGERLTTGRCPFCKVRIPMTFDMTTPQVSA